MRVAGVRGENTYELENGAGCKDLFSLPNRLRHVVFIRPGSFVLAGSDDSVGLKSKIKGEIAAVVLDLHLHELRKHPRWPPRFANATSHEPPDATQKRTTISTSQHQSESANVEEILQDSGDEDSSEESELEENPNQRKWDSYSLQKDTNISPKSYNS
jgi:hypothetical protein